MTIADKQASYHVKTLNLEVKDLDPQTRRVKVMLSHFDNIDSDSDVIRRGAFAKSIQERGPGSTSNRKIAFLRHHDWEQPVGIWHGLEETNEGLVGIGELSKSDDGQNAFADYQLGVIREHSIGFNYIEDKMNMVESGGKTVFEIKEVFLWEGSAVTFGSNSLTPTIDVSKGEHITQLAKVNAEMSALTKALKEGKHTDDRLHEFDMRLNIIQSKYNSLINIVPIESHEDEQPDSTAEGQTEQQSFYTNLF